MGIKIEKNKRIKKMHFVIEPRYVENLMGQFFQNFQAQGCNRFQAPNDTKWEHKINLSDMPTKPEDLNLKMDKTNVLSISGKSEVTKEQPNGFNIFSTHVWSKQVKVPDNVDQSTISAKMTSDMNQRILTISAELKKAEVNTEENAIETEQEIPIEKLD